MEDVAISSYPDFPIDEKGEVSGLGRCSRCPPIFPSFLGSLSPPDNRQVKVGKGGGPKANSDCTGHK